MRAGNGYHAGGRLEVLQHLLHERHGRVVVARRIVVGGGHVDGLDDAIVDEHREALAPGVPQHRHGTGVVEHQVELLGELAARVAEERDDGALDALVRCPCRHDGAIVHAVDQHIRDALGLQLILLGQVAWHLRAGSGGREGAGQADQHHLLALAVVRQRNLLRREALVEADVRDGVPDLRLERQRRGTTAVGRAALAGTGTDGCGEGRAAQGARAGRPAPALRTDRPGGCPDGAWSDRLAGASQSAGRGRTGGAGWNDEA
mmetsp:Transcript_53300/g.106971  ORF Transcript_53300/g.106971 Transcript_53300/m.106971 type:complete len:261 (-) Transcript_53300:82-864(-)